MLALLGFGSGLSNGAVSLVGLDEEGAADLVLVQDAVGHLQDGAGRKALSRHHPRALWRQTKALGTQSLHEPWSERAYPCMDIQKSTDINMIFGCQSSVIHTSVDIHINMQLWISMYGHSAMNIRKNKYPCMDFQKSPDIDMIFGCQSSVIHTSVDIHIDMQAVISIEGHYAMDILKI